MVYSYLYSESVQCNAQSSIPCLVLVLGSQASTCPDAVPSTNSPWSPLTSQQLTSVAFVANGAKNCPNSKLILYTSCKRFICCYSISFMRTNNKNYIIMKFISMIHTEDAPTTNKSHDGLWYDISLPKRGTRSL